MILHMDNYIVQKIYDNSENICEALNNSFVLTYKILNDSFRDRDSDEAKFFEYMKNNLCEDERDYWCSESAVYEFDAEQLKTHLSEKNNWALFDEWLEWLSLKDIGGDGFAHILTVIDMEYIDKRSLTTCLAVREMCRAGIPHEVIENITKFRLPDSVL